MSEPTRDDILTTLLQEMVPGAWVETEQLAARSERVYYCRVSNGHTIRNSILIRSGYDPETLTRQFAAYFSANPVEHGGDWLETHATKPQLWLQWCPKCRRRFRGADGRDTCMTCAPHPGELGA